jgi:hypothetical protein
LARKLFRDPIVVICVTVFLLLNGMRSFSQTQPTGSQTSQKSSNQLAEKIKQQITKRGRDKNVTVIMLNKTEYAGSVHSIEPDRFTVYEVDQKQLIDIKYDEVKKVLNGYGGKGISGKRVHEKRSLIVGAAILGGLLIAVLIGAHGG